jgi:hypothetical protein
VAMMVFYIGCLAATDYHPSSFERLAMPLLFAVGSFLLSKKVVRP